MKSLWARYLSRIARQHPGLSRNALGDFSSRHAIRGRCAAFTLVEALVALAILALFSLSTTYTLNLFDNIAARSRNTEAARAIIDDYTNYLLNDNTPAPAATLAGTDLDGDGVPDGVVCTAIGTRAVPSTVPLVVTRTATPTAVVNGTLYWRVQAVGTSYGLNADTDLLQVNFMLVYVYRGQTFYYKTLTFKAST